jgi:starvation-inducible DNA-binding protein
VGWTVLPEETAAKVAAELQPGLADLVDLHLIGKQAHWTVVGPGFQAAHERIDVLVDAWRLWTDQVAERIVILGELPKGRADDLTERDTYPLGWITDRDAIGALGARVELVASRMRAHQEAVADLDVVSDGLLQEIIEGLEEQLWMLRAHLQ